MSNQDVIILWVFGAVWLSVVVATVILKKVLDALLHETPQWADKLPYWTFWIGVFALIVLAIVLTSS